MKKAKRLVYRVTWNKADGMWCLKALGPSHEYWTKAAAIAEGRFLCKRQRPSQLVIHKADGKIQTEYTYGDDPRRTKG